jgi:hypothetical protein
MLHLSPERLAALAEDEPTTVEAGHLAVCQRCADERAAHSRLVALALRERMRRSEPLTSWSALAEELRSEGLINPNSEPMLLTTPARGVATAHRRRAVVRRGWMQAAAAVIVAAGGMAFGRYSAGAPVLAIGPVQTTAQAPAPINDLDGLAYISYASSTDAMTAFLKAQREMQQAAAYLAEQEQSATPGYDPEMYRARLAALDGMVSVSRAALYEAPADPVINQYYLATLGAREATMRQIGRTLPVGTQVTPY